MSFVPDRVIIYESELEYISRWTIQFPDLETGGDCFGNWTHTRCPVIQYVIGPGENAEARRSFFRQDKKYLQDCGKKLIQSFGLQHIGEWHSHHQLGVEKPSHHDIETVQNALTKYHLEQFFLGIMSIKGKDTRLHSFLVQKGKHYPIKVVILEGESPFRKEISDAILENSPLPKLENYQLPICQKIDWDAAIMEKASFPKNSYFNQNESKLVLQEFLKKLNQQFSNVSCRFNSENDFIIQCDKGQIIIPSNYPEKYCKTNFEETSSIDTSLKFDQIHV